MFRYVCSFSVFSPLHCSLGCKHGYTDTCCFGAFRNIINGEYLYFTFCYLYCFSTFGPVSHGKAQYKENLLFNLFFYYMVAMTLCCYRVRQVEGSGAERGRCGWPVWRTQDEQPAQLFTCVDRYFRQIVYSWWVNKQTAPLFTCVDRYFRQIVYSWWVNKQTAPLFTCVDRCFRQVVFSW